MEEWASLESVGFPTYEISNMGEVRNVRTEKILKTSPNQYGVVRIGLMKPDEGRQITLSLPRLVATMFVIGKSKQFNTPINLDGDRDNNAASNLVWRPRWFAVRYAMQFQENDLPLFANQIYDVETSTRFPSSREAACYYGLLEEDVMRSVVNGSPCFPIWAIFARVSH